MFPRCACSAARPAASLKRHRQYWKWKSERSIIIKDGLETRRKRGRGDDKKDSPLDGRCANEKQAQQEMADTHHLSNLFF